MRNKKLIPFEVIEEALCASPEPYFVFSHTL